MQPRVAVGIAVHAEPRRFRATVDAVRRTVPASVDVVVLPDRPDAETATALAADPSLSVLTLAEGATGGAACFNRLLATTDVDVCVLLECGCIPAPRWLEHLLAGMDRDPRNGLAGPSTNRAWNAQGVEPACAPTEAAIVSAARRLQSRRRGETRTLEPLYSLADFCYAVRREVWSDIGAADEGFGAGPCWEMEYNARAARAGWRGVWVPAAFVWRAPFTARRARDEQALFDPSRRRYQDRLCALRLRGETDAYQPHCRGDACEHFAPRALIQLRIDPRDRGDAIPASGADAPQPTPQSVILRPTTPSPHPSGSGQAEGSIAASARPHAERTVAAPSPTTSPGTPPRIPVATGDGRPLISCVMPTRGRPEYVLQSIRYFQAQDYPERELIILADADASGGLRERLPDDPRIRYVERPGRETIGAKRNRGAEMARGELIAQWDDDDWYAPGRLSAQAEPILAGRADVTALCAEVFFDLDRWEFWTCTPELHRRLFVRDVHGGTLVYRRGVWRNRAVYPAASLAEDAAFLHHAVRRGARLQRVDAPGLFIYLRHGANAWKFACGRYVDAKGWKKIGEPPHLAPDRSFYAARSPALRAPASPPSIGSSRGMVTTEREMPLVSCLMPTADRRRFVPRAIEHFLRQDYEPRELVIVDDGSDPVADLVPDDPRIRYLRVDRAQTLGDKRNLVCSLARGELLAHWDDDDWMADDRLSLQVVALESGRAEVCGLATVRYFDPRLGRAWEYRWRDRLRPWVGGNTLMYRRATWERRPFPALDEGEDTRWIWSLPPRSVHAMRDPGWFAALVHSGNTSRKQTRGTNWAHLPLDVIKSAMGDDWAFYAALAAPQRELAVA
jgi:glycosyltransferase involved in cell wall biosynthesis